MNEFGVIFVHDFFLDNGVVLALLRELGEEQKKLRRQNDLDHQRVEDCDAGARVQGSKRQKHDVNQHMCWSEQAKQAQGNRQRIPYRQLPHIAALVRVCPALRGFRRNHVGDVPKGRSRGGRPRNLYPASRRRARLHVDVGLEHSIFAGSSQSVDSIGH